MLGPASPEAPSPAASLAVASIVPASLGASAFAAVAASPASPAFAATAIPASGPASGMGAVTHSMSGSVFAGMGTQAPAVPPAKLHVSQSPWQGDSQHTPSVQLPEMQSLSEVHLAPMPPL